MDHLDQHLATSALDLSLPTSIRAAATLGKRTLNKYYTMTDLSEVYRIAMGKAFYLFRVCPSLVIDWTGSSTPSPQAQLLQGSQVGQEMDSRC
jgi:hypothetical protein